MMSPVGFSGALSHLQPFAPTFVDPAGSARAKGDVSFQDIFLKSLEQVNDLDRQSQAIIAGALTGEDYTQAEVFTAVKKADLALRTMLQIRNKLVDAYNELKNLRM